FMASQAADSFLSIVFGTGKGSGAALLFFVIGIVGVITCLIFRKDPHIWKLEE
ncbi:MAG: MFS transporter, partial [Christensenellaceae bacterium]